MKRTDERGMSGAAIFMVIVIIFLILLTGGLTYTLLKMGPGDEPNYVVEDVYFKKDGSDVNAMIFVTNLGKSRGKGDIEWEVTEGNRLIDKENISFQIDGRSTEQLEVFFEIGERDNFELQIEVYDGEELMDKYTKSVYL
ncbi:MAG: hypothetical protein V5A88_10050 [Candidatus Thermoplasmatota archaeon]